MAQPDALRVETIRDDPAPRIVEWSRSAQSGSGPAEDLAGPHLPVSCSTAYRDGRRPVTCTAVAVAVGPYRSAGAAARLAAGSPSRRRRAASCQPHRWPSRSASGTDSSVATSDRGCSGHHVVLPMTASRTCCAGRPSRTSRDRQDLWLRRDPSRQPDQAPWRLPRCHPSPPGSGVTLDALRTCSDRPHRSAPAGRSDQCTVSPVAPAGPSAPLVPSAPSAPSAPWPQAALSPFGPCGPTAPATP